MVKKEPVKITIEEALKWYYTKYEGDLHFGQYVRRLESENYKIIYTGDLEHE